MEAGLHSALTKSDLNIRKHIKKLNLKFQIHFKSKKSTGLKKRLRFFFLRLWKKAESIKMRGTDFTRKNTKKVEITVAKNTQCAKIQV